MEEHGKHDAVNDSNDKRNCIYLFMEAGCQAGTRGRTQTEQGTGEDNRYQGRHAGDT